MKEPEVRTTLRIPGNWLHPRELLARMPSGFRLTPDTLVLPDGTQLEAFPLPPDDQFAHIFKSSCRRPPREQELAILNGYTVKIGLTGPGGSLEAARTMLQAGSALIRAGGAGVFIDNCGLAHGGENWIEMAEDGESDAISFAFVSIIRGRHEVWTTGMHVMGLPEVVMKSSDLDDSGDMIIEVIRYICRGDKPIRDGHLLADLDGLRFQAVAIGSDPRLAGSPMHNPFGRLKLVSMQDIAESN